MARISWVDCKLTLAQTGALYDAEYLDGAKSHDPVNTEVLQAASKLLTAAYIVIKKNHRGYLPVEAHRMVTAARYIIEDVTARRLRVANKQ